MSIFKCKMCGGDLEVSEGINIAECEYCGTKQTVPTADNEKKVNLFNRANRLRIGGEFDKAAAIYESIVAEFPEEAETYWGLCLCNYGIEYVDDPATAKKIPTCHRASFESLQKDENFGLALEYADVVAQKVYRDEAREIDRIMSEILAVSKSEKPYDVFICYKETDEKGERTIDSVLAQDIYDALTAKGLKVFFARITLEDKLGQQYEPYIFAALNSAKVMLAIGTKYEYYHAVWVKNEWSRFLKLMAKDKTKTLIPCFKDLDAYDMPEEFKMLQAQDMGKIGAVQDLVRGVEKLVGNSTKTSTEAYSNSDASALTTRGYIYLEDEDFKRAESCFDRALDSNPMDSKAYTGKVLATLNLTSLDDIDSIVVDLSGFKDFDRAIRFATGLDKDLLESVKAKSIEKSVYTKLAYVLRKTVKKQEAEENRLLEKKRKEIDQKRALEQQKRQLQEKEKREIERKKYLEQQIPILKEPIEKAQNIKSIIVATFSQTLAIKGDGTVLATGNNDNQRNVMTWTDITSVALGNRHIVGLKRNGTVVGVSYDNKDQCNVLWYKNIIAIAAGAEHTVGLKKDGTVVAAGSYSAEQCRVSDWTDIVAIAACKYHTIGLRRDGTVVSTGENLRKKYGLSRDSRYSDRCAVGFWKDIVAIATGEDHTVGLKNDGSVVAVGNNRDGRCDVSDWTDIVAVSAGKAHTVGLKKDGTVVAVGSNYYGQCNLSDWTDIVAVAAGWSHTVGLRSDGTVVTTEYKGDPAYYYGQCDVSDWKLFDSIDDFENRQKGLCRHCGGTFKGLFTKKCSNCGKEKDY